MVTLSNPVPRRIFIEKILNQISIWFSQLADVGVECKKTFECSRSRSSSFYAWIVIQYGESFFVLRKFGDDFLERTALSYRKRPGDLGLIREAN